MSDDTAWIEQTRAALARAGAGNVPVVEWPAFMAWFRWTQDEHVTLIGPTGVGKSTLVRQIAPMRKFAWLAASKPVDATVDEFVKVDGWKIAADPKTLPKPRRRGAFHPVVEPVHLVVRPKFIDNDQVTYEDHQFEIFRRLLRQAFADGGWCSILDDVDYLINDLGLERYCRRLWALGRSGNSPVVSNLQRPRNVPLLAYSSATHLFLWATNDEDDLARLQGLGGLSTRLIRGILTVLPHHVALYVNTRHRMMAVTKVGR